jgi:hypothetical protein
VAGGVAADSGRWRSAAARRPRRRHRARRILPDGPHQAGIVLPTRPQTAAIFVTLDAVVGSSAGAATAIAELTS